MSQGGKMIITKNITLTSTPELIGSDRNIDKPKTIAIQNTDDSATIYLGNSEVSSSSYGVRLLPNQLFSADLGAYDNLYAVGSGTASIIMVER